MQLYLDVSLHGGLFGQSDKTTSNYTLETGEYVILKVLVQDGIQREENSVLMVSSLLNMLHSVSHFVSNCILSRVSDRRRVLD
jgi:hypothetical protein